MNEHAARIDGLLEAERIAREAETRYGDLPGVSARFVAGRIQARIAELQRESMQRRRFLSVDAPYDLSVAHDV